MIEINLSSRKKDVSLTKIGGIDLSKINVKGMLIAIILLYVPEMFLGNYYEGETEKINTELTTLRTKDRALKGRVSGLKNIENQINALKEQEQRLAQKLDVVREIINKKQNPYEVLKYLAQNTPADVWVTSIKITPDLRIEIIGKSRSWKSIGDFLDNLKNSIFFSKDISYSQPPQTVDPQDKQSSRYENFLFQTQIVRFE